MEPSAQLYLTTPPATAGRPLAPLLEAALAGGPVACVLIAEAWAMPEADLTALVRAVQAQGAAALIADDAPLAERVAADGVHVVSPSKLPSAIRQLKPERIVGAGRLATRDDAMVAGESGVDYVMIGDEPGAAFDDRLDRVAWWAGIFQVPCVAVARDLGEIAAFVEAGAEFVGLNEAVWDDTEGPAAAVGKAVAAIGEGHAAYLARQSEHA